MASCFLPTTTSTPVFIPFATNAQLNSGTTSTRAIAQIEAFNSIGANSFSDGTLLKTISSSMLQSIYKLK